MTASERIREARSARKTASHDRQWHQAAAHMTWALLNARETNDWQTYVEAAAKFEACEA